MPFKSQQQRRLMHATHPDMAKRWERETPKGKLPRKVNELGNGSGRYTAAFTHPDPLDPNDAQRQRTQARSISYPYDQPVSYGAPESPDDAGAKYQDGGYGGQLTPWFVKDDDGDIEKEASETPYNFGQSDKGNQFGGLMIPGQSRGFAGATKDDLDLKSWDVFGEEDMWPGVVRDRQLKALEGYIDEQELEHMSLGECFAAYNEESDEVVSLLERLDWE